MTLDLELTRTGGDRRLYTLAGVGTLRLSGWGSRRGMAEADGQRWEIARRGVWRSTIAATGAAGSVAGEFQGRMRGGVLRWSGRDLDLRREGMWRQRYVLSDGGRVVARIEGKSYGRRPVRVTVDDGVAFDPGLLLFAAFVVRALAADAAAAAS